MKQPDDTYRVLPHRDVIVRQVGYNNTKYEHKPCGMPLTERQVKEENWCPHCPCSWMTIIGSSAFFPLAPFYADKTQIDVVTE
jgi:hypothetical protein